ARAKYSRPKEKAPSFCQVPFRMRIRRIRPGLLRGDLRGILAWRHRNDNIFSLFVVHLGDAKDDFVLVQAKLSGLADGQQDRMRVVLGAQPIDDPIRLLDVFLAEQFRGLLMLTVGAYQFPGEGLATLLLHATRAGIHAEQSSLLIVGALLGGADRR